MSDGVGIFSRPGLPTGMRRLLSALWVSLLLSVHAAGAPSARPPLDVLARGFGGWPALRAVRAFAYRLTLTDGKGTVLRDAQYRLDLENGQVWSKNLLTGEEAWWDGTSGWRQAAPGRHERDEAAGTRLRSHAAYNFLRLLRDSATRAEWKSPARIRLSPAGADPFEVEIDPATGRILTNHFGDGTGSAEHDYQPVGPLVWPMRFIVPGVGGPRTGVFDEVRLLTEPAIAGSDP